MKTRNILIVAVVAALAYIIYKSRSGSGSGGSGSGGSSSGGSGSSSSGGSGGSSSGGSVTVDKDKLLFVGVDAKPEVRYLQELLNINLAALVASGQIAQEDKPDLLNVDGIFGNKTKSFIEAVGYTNSTGSINDAEDGLELLLSSVSYPNGNWTVINDN